MFNVTEIMEAIENLPEKDLSLLRKQIKLLDSASQLSFTDELETNMGIKDLSEKHNKYFYGEPSE